MILPEILNRIKQDSKFFSSFYHGLYHWRTVERNGLYLCQHTGADPLVISYFAYFHDCMRENEYEDPQHGARGAKYAKKLRKHIPLNDKQFQKLTKACIGHTDGSKTKCPTIGTCWDSDRLDIGRVGIPPRSKYMLTDEAKRIVDESDESVLNDFMTVER